MNVTMAWRNIAHQWARSLVAILGLSVALVFVFVELGFHAALATNSVILYRNFDFDIVLVSPHYQALVHSGAIARARLQQAVSESGVASIAPLWVGHELYRNPQTRLQHQIFAIGLDPDRPIFRDAALNAKLDRVKPAGAILMDRRSQDQYGPVRSGIRTEVRRSRVRQVGDYEIGMGFLAGAGMIVSQQTFATIFPEWPIDQIHVGLVQVADGADAAEVARRLNRLLGADVRALTPG